MIKIRTETADDCDGVRQVVIDAFTHSELGHEGEADIVDALRSNCGSALSLVAVDDDEIVGHILFSPVLIGTQDGDVHGMGLAPMAVAPHRQRSGIGTALVQAGLKQLADDGCAFVVVLGHPAYYQKFGFLPAAEIGISHGFEGIPQDVFLVNILDVNARLSNIQGTACYRSEFGPQSTAS